MDEIHSRISRPGYLDLLTVVMIPRTPSTRSAIPLRTWTFMPTRRVTDSF